MASVTYGIQAVRVPSGSFNFVLLITFRRPVGQTMSVFIALNRFRSPYSCNTFIPVNHPQVTRDRRQTETRLWWSPFGFYVRNRLVAEVYGMFPLSPTFGAPDHASYGSPRMSYPHASQHDKRYRQRLHGAEERLVMKQSVCGPPAQLPV
jgi:hypothetical protein